MSKHDDEDRGLAVALRRVFCMVFCPCTHHRKRRATVTLDFGNGNSLTFNYVEGEEFMATVRKDGGPLKMDISAFVDDKGNPVTDNDTPTYTSSDESIATVAASPDNAQEGVITLLGVVTAPEQTVVVKASFPAQRGGQPFEVVGNLVVIEPAAASAQATISGPGVIEGA